MSANHFEQSHDVTLLLVTCSNIQYAKYNFAFEGCILVTFYYYVTTIECYDI